MNNKEDNTIIFIVIGIVAVIIIGIIIKLKKN
jgi:LPXTG-motif cell wall-anchored protein